MRRFLPSIVNKISHAVDLDPWGELINNVTFININNQRDLQSSLLLATRSIVVGELEHEYMNIKISLHKTPYQCYVEYLALRAHFTSSYSYQKYQGKIKAITPAAFKARRDYFYFERMAKHDDPFNLILSNFVDNTSLWIGDIVSSQGTAIYKSWVDRTQAMTYNLTQDLHQLNHNFNENFVVLPGEHPFLIKLYLSKKINTESFVILVDMARCFSSWDKKMSKDDVVWQEVSKLYQNYRPFLAYDKRKAKSLIIKHFSS